MAQTVMAALIERAKIANDNYGGFEYENFIEQLLRDAEEMIKQEREQIEYAFFDGSVNSKWINADTYYNQTYLTPQK